GAAPLDHLPTMAAGQAPPPTPPPGTPAYGYPQQHPQPVAYGYPRQPPGHGSTPPYGPGLYLPATTPEPPRRNGRSTAALIVVALIVAIGAGGTVYAVMNGEDTDKHGDDGKNAASSAPTTPGDDSPTPGPTTPDATTPAAQDDTIPDKYLGTWTGGLDTESGHSTRQLTLQQGEVGDTVLAVTADGPTKDGGTYHCVFQGKLVSASEDRLRIGPTDVTIGEPMESCTPGESSVITILGNGKLRRANTDGTGELTYDRG
ncbi:serine/threonine protein kinase, partial [Streptomyces arenae]|nr:serine/threonine protein kinase [Streptomyces arenae]